MTDSNRSTENRLARLRTLATSSVVGAELGWLLTQYDQQRAHLAAIKNMTNANDPNSYRSDDREGCLDAVFSRASRALDGIPE